MGKRLDAVALRITRSVGTMYAAIGFGCLTLISLPAAIGTQDPVIIVQWVAATFLQLVLLPVIMVGQNSQAKLSEEHAQQAEAERAKHAAVTEALIKETHDAVIQELAELHNLTAHVLGEVKD